MQDAFSPHTGEFIPTSTPAAWMGRAGSTPPAFDPKTASAFFKNSAWAIVQALIPTDADILLVAQKSANAAIDAQAGATRLKYITDVPGQAETYLSKASDATAYKSAGYPSASIVNYPMVQAEGKAISGTTPTAAQFQAAADGILIQQLQWVALAAAIEQQRRAGKIAVAGATSPATVQAAQQAAITALQAL